MLIIVKGLQLNRSSKLLLCKLPTSLTIVLISNKKHST